MVSDLALKEEGLGVTAEARPLSLPGLILSLQAVAQELQLIQLLLHLLAGFLVVVALLLQGLGLQKGDHVQGSSCPVKCLSACLQFDILFRSQM